MDIESLAKLLEWITKIAALITAVCGIGLFYVNGLIKEKQSKANATNGVISENKKEPNLEEFRRPVMAFDSGRPPETKEELAAKIKIEMGGSSVYMPRRFFEEGKPIQKIIDFNGSEPFVVKIRDNKILITTKVFSIDGKLVSEIVDNEWKVAPSNHYMRNYDDNAFEVVDPYDITVLQVEYKDKQTIYIAGVFQSGGAVLVLGQNGMQFLGGKMTMDAYRENTKSIKRIFDYSGKNYLGKRAK